MIRGQVDLVEHMDGGDGGGGGDTQFAIRQSVFAGGLVGSAFQPQVLLPKHSYHSASADCLIASFPLDMYVAPVFAQSTSLLSPSLGQADRAV